MRVLNHRLYEAFDFNQVDNTKNNFDNYIMPILKNFYNSL